ncbi:sodium channel and clathrin linker 1-like isoform X2 [Neocloeon triangulifer]|uniref:sodium channel and clathrin linker 1-like isoform X2 n=1 Tax=Neocloeon triangulifer TaxID=2078957 RepID=UPI00286EF0CA|nr:sodium channel and clathrin linker 1-like isoform X2 [Neocloeon triangulifer]
MAYKSCEQIYEQIVRHINEEDEPSNLDEDNLNNKSLPKEIFEKEDIPVSRKLNFSGLESIIDHEQIQQRPLTQLLTEYEDVNRGLQVLFEHYQREHIYLKNESVSLTKENERLSNRLKQELESDIKSHDATEEANLKQQLQLALHEKEVVLDLWRLAVSEVSNLEKVIKILQEQKDVSFNSSSHNIEARANSVAESQLTEARTLLVKERMQRSELEGELSKERETRQALNQQLALALGQVQELEQDKQIRQDEERRVAQRVSSLSRERDDLQRALDRLQGQLKEMRMQAEEGQSKVADALTLVDSACVNRDQTVFELAKAKEEILRLENALKDLTQDAKQQVKREVEQVKQQCNLHVKSILADVKKSQEEGSEYKNKAEKAMYSQKQAEQLVEQKAQELYSIRSRESSLEPKLHAVQAQLRDMEKRCSVAERKAQLVQQNYAEESDRWRMNELRVTETCKILEKQVSSLALELEHSKVRESNLAKDLSLREQQFAWRVKEMEKSTKATTQELSAIISSHQKISEKSKSEMRQMAEKFSHRLKELRFELGRLREERDEAVQQLQQSTKISRNNTPQITPRPKSLFMDV